MIFLASTEKTSSYRKPKTGMWDLLHKEIFSSHKIDVDQSFYCGDAAGRKGNGFNDFSSDDLIFSMNIDIKFYTPEMFFKGHDINYKVLNKSNAVTQKSNDFAKLANTNTQEMIIFVGSPGSGKSTFYRDHLSHHYQRVNNDTTKNAAKNEKLCK